MMSKIENPALKQFVASIGDELVLAQVLVRPSGSGWELRHVENRTAGENSLRTVKVKDARALAQHTAADRFRPLKSAPTLQRGWRMLVASDAELELALNHLYPGAIADWYAAQQTNPPVTNYREFTARQTGMYRITTLLTDAQAAEVINAGCDKARCLKCRLWTVSGLAPDAAAEKSIIPCLEPCALLMESARKAVRSRQEQEKSPGNSHLAENTEND